MGTVDKMRLLPFLKLFVSEDFTKCEPWDLEDHASLSLLSPHTLLRYSWAFIFLIQEDILIKSEGKVNCCSGNISCCSPSHLPCFVHLLSFPSYFSLLSLSCLLLCKSLIKPAKAVTSLQCSCWLATKRHLKETPLNSLTLI